MSNIKTVIDEKEKVIYTDEPVICSSCNGQIWRNAFIFESGRKYCNKCMRAKYMYEIKEVKDEVSNTHSPGEDVVCEQVLTPGT